MAAMPCPDAPPITIRFLLPLIELIQIPAPEKRAKNSVGHYT
jgi:hypothetical protein